MSDKKITELPLISTIDADDISLLVSEGADYKFAFSTLLQFIGSNLNVGANISFGTTLPQNTSGKNGDVFIKTNIGAFAQKVAGTWTVVYTLPSSEGSTDGTVLYGLGVPGNLTGNNNDTYIDTGTGIFYKKSAGAWSQAFSMQTGPQGPQGSAGANGTNGTNGFSVLSGTTVPSNLSTGINGDFYINTTTYNLFGPKTAGNWGSGISLSGPGIAIDGNTGNALVKASADNFDTEWVDFNELYLQLSGGILTGDVQYDVAPVNATSLINKGYVDNAISGLNFKTEVIAASTTNVIISSAPALLDGVSLINGDRMLLKNQTDATENGIYIFNGSGSSLIRSTDADTGPELANKTILVSQGANNQDTWWTVKNDTIILGTTNINLTQTGGAGTYVNGTGILLAGNIFSMDTAYTSTLYPLITDVVYKNGVSGGQTIYGGAGNGESLMLNSTINATKGKIFFGANSAFDESTSRFGIGTTTPGTGLHIYTTSGSSRIRWEDTSFPPAYQRLDAGFDDGVWKMTIRDSSNVSKSIPFSINSVAGTGDGTNGEIRIPGGWLLQVAGGIRTNTTGVTSNLYVLTNGSAAATQTQSQVTFLGSSGVHLRRLYRGSIPTVISDSYSYAGSIFGQESVIIGTSGTHAGFGTSVFKAPVITAGTAALTNAFNVYFESAPTGATNNYNIWASTGINRFDGDNILSDGTVISPSAKLHIVKTTEQLRLGYDASNYATFTVSSTGQLIIDRSSGLPTILRNGVAISTSETGGFEVTSTWLSLTSSANIFDGSSGVQSRNVITNASAIAADINTSVAATIYGTSRMTKAASGVHPVFATVVIKAPNITGTGSTVTNAASLYLQGAPTGGTNNYTLWSVGAVKFDLGSDATGDIFYGNSPGTFARLGVGSNGQVLTLASGLPSWAAPSTILANNNTFTGTNIFANTVDFNAAIGIHHQVVFSGSNAVSVGRSRNFALQNNAGTFYTQLAWADVSANQTITFPNATGTLVLADDLSAYVPTSRTLTINGTTYDLTANRSWSITAGVSSVSGATSRITSTGGVNPVIDINSTFEALLGKLAGNNTWSGINEFDNKLIGSVNFAAGSFSGFTSTAGKWMITNNYTGGGGETDLFANIGSAGSVGGFDFYGVDNSTNVTLLARINGVTKDFTSYGRIAPTIVDASIARDNNFAQYDQTTGVLVSRTNTEVKSDLGMPIGGDFLEDGDGITTTFTVSIGVSQGGNPYKISITPTNDEATEPHYITNKTDATFDVVFNTVRYLVAFDWVLIH